jgi:cholesterol transport system auxiliary component
MKQSGRFVACGLAALLLGCAGAERPARQTFSLEVGKPAVRVTPPPTAPVLAVAFAEVTSQFSGEEFVYRTSEDRWESDPYNGFVIPVPEMVTQATRRWMEDTGMYMDVVAPRVGGPADFVLNCSVRDFYGDFRDPASPRAVVKMEVELLTGSPYERRRVAVWPISSGTPLAERTPAGLVRAWNESMRTALTQLQGNLAAIGR